MSSTNNKQSPNCWKIETHYQGYESYDLNVEYYHTGFGKEDLKLESHYTGLEKEDSKLESHHKGFWKEGTKPQSYDKGLEQYNMNLWADDKRQTCILLYFSQAINCQLSITLLILQPQPSCKKGQLGLI